MNGLNSENINGLKNIECDNIYSNYNIQNVNSSYFTGITSNLQNQINNLYTISGGVYYNYNNYNNNNYNDILSLSGLIYNNYNYIQNNYSKYEDVITLSGMIYNNYNYICNNFVSLSGLMFTALGPHTALSSGSVPVINLTKQINNNILSLDFKFSIPKGDTGAQGAQGGGGPRGDTGDDGKTGPRGPRGSTGSSAGADAMGIVNLVATVFGIGVLGAGELALQAQIATLFTKTAFLTCVGGTTIISSNTNIIAPTSINLISTESINILPLFKAEIASRKILLDAATNLNLESKKLTTLRGDDVTIMGVKITYIGSINKIEIRAPEIVFIGKITQHDTQKDYDDTQIKISPKVPDKIVDQTENISQFYAPTQFETDVMEWVKSPLPNPFL